MVPKALRIVAVVHLLLGIIALIGIFYKELVLDRVNIDLGVLGIPIYYGLLRFSAGWRTVALALLWLAMITLPFVFVVGFLGDGPAQLAVPGVYSRDVSPIWLSVVSVPAFLLAFWQYRVLTRPAIRALFGIPAAGVISGAPHSP